LREPLKFLERNIPELTRMAAAYMALGTLEELREQIIEVALQRAFLADRCPPMPPSFQRRLEEGRPRLNLIAQEVARQAAEVLAEHAAAVRKLKDSKPAQGRAGRHRRAAAAAGGQALPAADTPWPALHAPAALPEGRGAAAG
jgi:ATP-dependent helicase HrpA